MYICKTLNDEPISCLTCCRSKDGALCDSCGPYYGWAFYSPDTKKLDNETEKQSQLLCRTKQESRAI